MVSKAELFPSKWFRATDLPDSGLSVKISNVTRERVGPEQKEKPVVHFSNHDKSLVLNVTNFDLIATALNEADTDKWPGREIELFATETSFGGKTFACVRARKHRTPPVIQTSKPEATSGPDDDMPWDDASHM